MSRIRVDLVKMIVIDSRVVEAENSGQAEGKAVDLFQKYDIMGADGMDCYCDECGEEIRGSEWYCDCREKR